jgi:two-component system sensor histidine kinase DegS
VHVKERQLAEEPQNPILQLLDECHVELEQTEKELKEIDILVRQSAAEVEKLVRRNADITNRLRQIESSFDTVPREDIQNIYTTVQREQGRLFMMRGQSEKLQGNQESLVKYRDLLDRVIKVLEKADIGRAEGPFDAGEAAPAQSMVVRIIEAQESERRRLARQMHDGPAQLLTNLILQAEICQRLLDTDPERARAELENLKAEVNKTFQSTRTFIADLRPMMLDDLGLVPTLRRFVNTWSEKTGIKADLAFAGREHRLAPYTEVTIFRVIQDLMDNAAKHANPSQVQVTLQLDGQVAQVIVEDDGSGFDVDQVLAAVEERKALGIALILDRVHMLGGTLEFDSVLGRGTKAILEVPEA